MHFKKKKRGDSRRKSLICKFSEEIRGDSMRKMKIEEIRGVSRSCGNPEMHDKNKDTTRFT